MADHDAKLVEAARELIASRTSVARYETMITGAFISGHRPGSPLEMLTIREFISHSGFDASDMYVDRFYANLRHDMPILIDDGLIEWLGYKGVDKDRRASLIRTIQTLDPKGTRHNQYTFGELQMMTSNYIKCATTGAPIILGDFGTNVEQRNRITPAEIALMYPPVPMNSSTKQRKFVLIYPSLLDEVMMSSRTERGQQIRQYFIRMKDLQQIYGLYQEVFRLITLQSATAATVDKANKYDAMMRAAAI